MTTATAPALDSPRVQRLLAEPHYAVVSTLGSDGSIHSTIVWVDLIDGQVAVNSALGRRWPSDLESNPTITLVVYDGKDPYDFVEIRGTATRTLDGAEEHIDRLAKKYTGKDTYPWRKEGERRVTFLIEPTRVRHSAG